MDFGKLPFMGSFTEGIPEQLECSLIKVDPRNEFHQLPYLQFILRQPPHFNKY